jgi:hypothetical protein
MSPFDPIIDRECFRCTRIGHPMHRLLIVDVEVAQHLGEAHVYVCNDCLAAWRAHRVATSVLEQQAT